MITRVRLTNWKAYDNFDLELTSGTTFLVARNGIGKSSFIDAVRWVLDPNPKPDQQFMRRLAVKTSVTVDLQVGQTEVSITRTLTKGRAATPEIDGTAMVGGEQQSVAEALEWVATAWKADPGFLHRSAFLTDQLLLDPEERGLEDHLVRLYGLDELRSAETAARAAASQFEDQARAAKKATKTSAAEVANAEDAAAVLAAAAEAATAAAKAAADAAAAAEGAVRAAEDAVVARQTYESWETDYAALTMDVEGLLGDVPPDANIESVLTSAEQGARAQFVRDTERRAALTERIAAVDAALERLHTSEGDCPICRRALDDDSRQHAEAAHQADRTESAAALSELHPEVADNVVTDIVRLRRRLHDLGPRPDLPDEPARDPDELREAADAAAAHAQTASQTAEQARAKALVANERLVDLREAARNPDPVHLYEQAGLLTAGARALDRTIEEVLKRQLGPLSDEVNRRWEALFPDRPGLEVSRKGQLARTYDDDGDPLPFTAFSSGEKVIAKVLMRLTTLSKTTDIPFIWIDEPLEHLDPVSRVYVAKTLSLLTSGDGMTQIVITTYEDELARRLEAEDDHPVSLRVLRNASALN